MWKLLLLVILNIIVLTSCADIVNKNVTKVEEATVTAKTNSGSSGATASASASAKATVITTTSVKNNYSSSANGSTNNGTCGEYDDDFDCSGDLLVAATRSITKLSFQYLCVSNIRPNIDNWREGYRLPQYSYEMMTYTTREPKIASPLSTWYLMGIMANYTEGKTQREILNFLGLNTTEEVGCLMKLINSFTKNQPKDVKHYYSSNVAADRSISFSETFRQDMKIYVKGRGLNNFNFNKSQQAASGVNKIIYKDTNKKVKNTISSAVAPKIFNKLSSLIFAAGVSFRSPFQKAFNPNNITMGNYTNEYNNVIQVPFLYQKAIYKYTNSCSLKAEIIEIPFIGDFTFLYFLPNSVSGLPSLVKKLAENPELLEEDYKCLKERFLYLYLPMYNNATSVTNTVAVLNSTDEVNLLLNKTTAQVTDYCGNPLKRYISAGIQKTRLEFINIGEEPYNVDECSKETKNMEAIEVKATHPACFLVLLSGVPLVCGVGNVMV